MASEYVRPDIDRDMLKELEAGRTVVLDPTWEDVLAALAQVQRRAKKNLLTVADARALWEQVVTSGQPGAWAGQWSCPRAFHYGIEGTVLQLVRLGAEHTGLVAERQKIAPGGQSSPAIQYNDLKARLANPDRWAEQALAVFWMRLTDQQVEQIRRRVV
jgi:hypothetical protein